MNRTKCYISGKISGLPEEIYRQLFDQAKKEVIELGMIPVSPVELSHDHPGQWQDFMREDIIAMMDCHCIYVLRNWRESTGAKVEVELANTLGFTIIHQSTVQK